MDTRNIGEYCWGQVPGEEPELSVVEVVRALGDHVIGLRAVNVSRIISTYWRSYGSMSRS